MDFSFLPAPNPAQLNAILASYAPNRPLDPNGIDVYGELPKMQEAYRKTANGMAIRGTQEAMYAILPGGNRTRTQLSGNRRDAMAVPNNALAIVHTHPVNAKPTPGPEDSNMNFPNYVYSGNQLYVTTPHDPNRFYKYDIDKWGFNNAFLANAK